MTEDEIERSASRLLADHDVRRARALAALPRDLTVPEAYRLQDAETRLRQLRGERVIGYKVGCIGRAVQEQLGIHQPIFGRLFASECYPQGARLSGPSQGHLAIEGELAVRLCADLPHAVADDAEYIDAIAAAFPVIELHHMPRPVLSCPELIACNGMHAGFVLPDAEAPFCAADSLPELRVEINDAVVAAGPAANPLPALRWLAAALSELGLRLTAGQIVLTGSALPLLPIAAPSRVVVTTATLGTCRAELGP